MKFQQAEDLPGGERWWRTGNPGADFVNLLGIGSKTESVIIKGTEF